MGHPHSNYRKSLETEAKFRTAAAKASVWKARDQRDAKVAEIADDLKFSLFEDDVSLWS